MAARPPLLTQKPSNENKVARRAARSTKQIVGLALRRSGNRQRREPKEKRMFLPITSVARSVGIAGMLLVGGVSVTQAATPKFKVYVSLSYYGNGWFTEAANMIKAMAAYKTNADKIDLVQVQVAGPNAQKQIQQINSMVEAGANAIVVYPVSPTALNTAVRNACDRGVLIYAFDSAVEEPCAHNVASDHLDWGEKSAEWLAKKLNGKGNVVVIGGVAGATADTLRKQGMHEVFAKYPGIKILAEDNGLWSNPGTREALTRILTTHSWDEIDAVWAETGCYAAVSMMKEAGVPDDKLRPCVDEGDNGGRVQMLPADYKLEGTNGNYQPMGAPKWVATSGVYSGALTLKLAIKQLEGENVPLKTVIPTVAITNDTVKVCETGSWAEMKAGCNVFKPSVIKNPDWTAGIFSELTPEVGLDAALTGKPEP
jgi:ribose transport system substrate-binding protein